MRSMSLCRALLVFASSLAVAWNVCAGQEKLWPSIEQRTTLSKEGEVVLLQEWKAAKASGLLIRREELLRKVSSVSEGYSSIYFKFNNPALIEMMAEFYRVEYGNWQKYEFKGPEELKPHETASCVQEVRSEREYDESEMEYTNWVNYLALSTYSPEIVDVVMSYYCDRP